MPVKKSLGGAIGHFLVLFAFWLLLSGHYDPLLLSFGVGSCLLAVWLAGRMSAADAEGHPAYLLKVTLFYWPWLAKEILLANWDVIKIILRPELAISPTVVRVKAEQSTDLGQVIYANSITLTPGTVTVEMTPGELTIHALTREAAQALETGDMGRRVSRLMDPAGGMPQMVGAGPSAVPHVLAGGNP